MIEEVLTIIGIIAGITGFIFGGFSLYYTRKAQRINGPNFNFPVSMIETKHSTEHDSRLVEIILLIQNNGDRMGYLWFRKIVFYYNKIKASPKNLGLPVEISLQIQSQTLKRFKFVLSESYNENIFMDGYLLLSGHYTSLGKLINFDDVKVCVKQLNISV